MLCIDVADGASKSATCTCCAIGFKCGSCCSVNLALVSFTATLTLTGVFFIVYSVVGGMYNREEIDPL